MSFEVLETEKAAETIVYQNLLEVRLSVVHNMLAPSTGEESLDEDYPEGSLQLFRRSPDNFYAAHYSYTGRGREYIVDEKIYPSEMVDFEELKGKVVLDLHCGNGKLVDEMRNAGIEAFGIDLYLPPHRRELRYLVQAIFEESHPSANQFDVIYSTYGNLFFHTDLEKSIVTLGIVHKILKQGGVLRVSPVKRGELEDALKYVPGLVMQPIFYGWDGKEYAELRKTA
ncbi:MAG: methyltransferase domain-containing protein [Candidatus Gracilibacteria bacterium]